MNTLEILNALRSQLVQVKPTLPADMPAHDAFRQVWSLDSLELVEFVARIEQKFQLIIPDADLELFTDLQSTAGYISSRLDKTHG